MFLPFRNLIITQFLDLLFREKYNGVFRGLKFRLEGFVIHQGIISLFRRPVQEPFEEIEFLPDGRILEAGFILLVTCSFLLFNLLCITKIDDELCQSFLGKILETEILVKGLQVIPQRVKLFIGLRSPGVLNPTLPGEGLKSNRELNGFATFLDKIDCFLFDRLPQRFLEHFSRRDGLLNLIAFEEILDIILILGKGCVND